MTLTARAGAARRGTARPLFFPQLEVVAERHDFMVNNTSAAATDPPLAQARLPLPSRL